MSKTVGDLVVAIGSGIWTLRLRSLALLCCMAILMFGLWIAYLWSWNQLDQQAGDARRDVNYYRQKGSTKNIEWLERKLLSSSSGEAIKKDCTRYELEQRDLLGVWVFLSASEWGVHRDAARFMCLVRAANQKRLLVPWESPEAWDSDATKLLVPGYKRSYD